MASSSWKSAASLAMWNVLKYNLPCPYLPAGRLILLGKVDEPSFYITDFPPPHRAVRQSAMARRRPALSSGERGKVGELNAKSISDIKTLKSLYQLSFH